MKIISKKAALFLPCLLGAAISKATPTLYPTEPAKLFKVANLTNSSLVADDADSRKVWVLPPNIATASVGRPQLPTANLGFCRAMGELQSYSADITSQIADLNMDKKEHQKKADETSEQLQAAQLELANYVHEKQLGTIKDLDVKIDNLNDRLDELYSMYEKCTQSCESIHTDISKTEKERDVFMEERRILAKQYRKEVVEYEKKSAVVEVLKEKYQKENNYINNLISDQLKVQKIFDDLYEKYGKLEGLTMSFTYVSDWDSNLKTLRLNNPDFQFEKIPTQSAKVFSSLMGVKNIPGQNAIMAYLTPGHNQSDHLTLDSGFPEAFQSEVLLSLIGACPVVHPEYFDLNKEDVERNLRYGLIISYEFPASMQLKAEAKYNMYQMYQKIVSAGSSGGLFSSHSWSHAEEHREFQDSFKVNWAEQDPQNSMSEERRLAIEHQMRTSIIDRIANIALQINPMRDGIIKVNPPPKHGALVIASDLINTCPQNNECVVGSFLLSSLNAIFSSGSSFSSYIKTQDFESTENWQLKKVIMRPWITSYSSEIKP